MSVHRIATQDEWLTARKALLESEKKLTRLRDEVGRERRAMPWVRIEKPYVFETPAGSKGLADLFAGSSQLLVYHFMFGPDWEEGCKSCSFWADSFDRISVHLKHRDAAFVAISRAPLDRLLAFRDRMGWSFPWVSSLANDFNFDFGVSFTPDDRASGTASYNFRVGRVGEEMPGASAFVREADGSVFHTYSTYSRGLDGLNAAYSWLDLAPKGRDEDELEFTMSWVRHHDRYEAAA